MYQGGSDCFLAPTEDIPQIDFSHGTDFEGEVGVIVDETPMGVSPEKALEKIRLFVLINDVSLRGLIPEELAQGFGFLQSKSRRRRSRPWRSRQMNWVPRGATAGFICR